MKKNTLKAIVLIVASSVMLVLVYSLTGWIKSRQNERIEKHGTATTGIVIDKSIGADDSGRQFAIKYEFFAGDTLVQGFMGLADNSYYYDKAVIGQKYLVKYINDGPGKRVISKIYIDSPIQGDFRHDKRESAH